MLSVKFFKRIITVTIIITLVSSIGMMAYFAVSLKSLQKQIDAIPEGLISTADPVTKLESSIYAYASPSFAYQKDYPDLYVDNDFMYENKNTNIVYLTFDDGPTTSVTPQILDILKKYNIKATFFIVYKDDPEVIALYKRMIDEGHTLGIHTASHQYTTIYQSVDAFLYDFATAATGLYEATGYKAEIFRFPGGSINNYNKAIYMPLIAEMTRRGYTYYDWDVSSGDATNKSTEATIYNSIVNGVSGKSTAIVLMHDAATKQKTVDALEQAILTLGNMGYTFDALDQEVKPATFSYIN